MIDFDALLTAYISFLLFILGTVIGSFLNVLIYRLPTGMSFQKGRSFCPSCRHELTWKDLFPLFSWVFLRGKCRYCKEKISKRYPIVELLTGTLYVLAYLFLAGGDCFSGLNLSLLGWCTALSALVVISFVDFEHQIIPDSMWITIFAGGVFVVLGEVAAGKFKWESLVGRVIGIFAVSFVFFLIGVISKGRAMGGGDVKLMAAAGFVLGWKAVILSLFLGAFAGVIYSIFSRIIRKTEMRGVVPFGPFLAIGIAVTMFVGDRIIEYYISFIK
ncbi:MAG: Type 4 prepilin-like proteins leader peptide-processing enzyme [Firmicutes bacterium ADurb.Bin300]|nr:MAG: Type 4 prepilin-like proteins leader peptide-processing enzyme [Firmicutes bacterium ADurb.Bin300]HOD02855.1 prepilin peptidase [Clostridiales bacterium]